MYAAGETFKAFRCAFALLKDGAPYSVVAPYADMLADHFRARRSVDMRFFDMFITLIKASAIRQLRR